MLLDDLELTPEYMAFLREWAKRLNVTVEVLLGRIAKTTIEGFSLHGEDTGLLPVSLAYTLGARALPPWWGEVATPFSSIRKAELRCNQAGESEREARDTMPWTFAAPKIFIALAGIVHSQVHTRGIDSSFLDLALIEI